MGERPLCIFVRTLGCRANLADAADVLRHLDRAALRLVKTPAEADVALLNTCTVTHKADRDARKILSSLARNHPDLPVVVTGCGAVTSAQRMRCLDNVRAVVPPGDPRAVARGLGARLAAGALGAASPFFLLGRQRALAKVQDGCDARCTYCIVPRVRGPARSASLAQAQRRVAELLAMGHREVVLTGIHLGRYGRDRVPPVTLADLLDRLGPVFAAQPEACRLRLSSIEPLEWTAELIAAVERHRFVCRHFHVPLQSGDDGVLGRMGRPYTAEVYARVVERLHARFDRSALGADVLVGFPGEDDPAAARTLRLVRALPLAYLHVFPFSRRPGTPAAALPRQVPADEVRQRAAELRRIGSERWRRFAQAGLGAHHRVLLEREGPRGPEGLSEHYRRVRLQPPTNAQDAEIGSIVEVRAESMDGDCLLGRLTTDPRGAR